eukprot:6491825-Amphidinium_carterae.1
MADMWLMMSAELGSSDADNAFIAEAFSFALGLRPENILSAQNKTDCSESLGMRALTSIIWVSDDV